MADLFKLTLNELEFGVEVPEGVLADIVEVYSNINDYNSWKKACEVLYTTGEGDEAVVDTEALDAFATKERFFAVQLRDYVLEGYAGYKRNQAISQADAQVRSVIDSVKNSVITVE